MAKYDIAISFAGEQRELARELADRLDASGYSVFFDQYHEAELWGRDLTIALGEVYEREARWCLVILSQEYVRKPWTNLERQNALARFMRERSGYLLCLKTDDANLPGLPSVIGYVSTATHDRESIFRLLLQKLGRPAHDDFIALIDQHDRVLARGVIEACYRRAIFTRMDSEIGLSDMYDSIAEAIGKIQSLIPRMQDQNLQFGALRVVNALDEIERVRTLSPAGVSNHLEPELRRKIDDLKLDVIRLLLEIRRAAAVAIQFPTTLRVDHFFGPEAARQPPREDV